MDKVAKPQARRLVLLVWVLVAFFYFWLSYDYIRVSMNDDEFADYLQYVVRIAGDEYRPAKEVRALVLVKAEELGLPVRGDQITIMGGGQALNIDVGYAVDIHIPIFERGIYTKEFRHQVSYKPPR
jgi:hypothetical protein